MLRRLLSAVALTCLVVVAGTGAVSANAPATQFRAHLTGAQENPANGSAATGTMTLRLTDNDTKLHFRLRSRGLDQVTQSHIHVGVAGKNGPVVVFLFAPTPAAFGGSVTGEDFEVAGVRKADDFRGITFADFVTQLRAGGTYVNIHSPTFPAGEIRGQITPVRDEEED